VGGGLRIAKAITEKKNTFLCFKKGKVQGNRCCAEQSQVGTKVEKGGNKGQGNKKGGGETKDQNKGFRPSKKLTVKRGRQTLWWT